MKRPPFGLWHLLCVQTIAEKGSIHAAADFLNVRQSTVSRSLHGLEELLGISLFIRSASGTVPTTFGCEFIRWSETLLDNVSTMTARARRFGNGEAGGLAIGLQSCVVPGRFSRLAAEFLSTHPDIIIHYSEGAREHLLNGLGQRELDFAIVTRRGTEQDLRSLPLWSDKIVVALRAN